jgi:hypothetical protein
MLASLDIAMFVLQDICNATKATLLVKQQDILRANQIGVLVLGGLSRLNCF